MTIVEFENPSEFLAELRKDSRYVERGIVRVAECRRASAIGPVLLMSVVETACVGADICRIESAYGGGGVQFKILINRESSRRTTSSRVSVRD